MQTLFYLGQQASADLGYVSNATTSRCFAVIINQNKTGKIKTEQAKSKQNRQNQNRTGKIKIEQAKTKIEQAK